MRNLPPYYHYLFASILMLVAAYFVEYVLGFKPCTLCIYQRIPYFIVIILSSILIAKNLHMNYYNFIFSAIFLFGAILATYHVGVEEGIFQGLDSCHSDVKKHAESIADMKSIILAKTAPSCNHAEIKIFSLSLASWNAIISIIFSYYAYLKFKKNNAK